MIFCRLLDPDVESSGSLFVGSYMLVLILHLQAQMAPHIPELVAAIVRRMQSCEAAGLKSSLLVILARLVNFTLDFCYYLYIYVCNLVIELHIICHFYLIVNLNNLWIFLVHGGCLWIGRN